KAHGVAIGRSIRELIGADDAAGAADVLDDDGRFAGNVGGQMLRDDAPLDVARSARRIVDDHGDGLALVELGKRAIRAEGGKHNDEGGDQRFADHGSNPFRTCLATSCRTTRPGSYQSVPAACGDACKCGRADARTLAFYRLAAG